MADGRKRRKAAGGDTDTLTQLLHTGGVSTVGLSQLLERLRGVDLSELAASRYHLREANLQSYRRLQHTEAMPLTSGGAFDWELLHPNLLLAEMAGQPSAFQSHVIEAYRRRPPSTTTPWNLVIGFDEFTPGVRGWFGPLLSVAAQPFCVSGTAAEKIVAGSKQTLREQQINGLI